MTTLTNPGPGGRYANIEGVQYGTDKPGGTVTTKSALHATCLVEHGFVMDPAEYQAALDEAADRARAENSSVASASASEGKILARQATVDVESGAVTTPPADPFHPDDPVPAAELAGEALEKALTDRGLVKTGTADEKRARVGEYDTARDSGDFVVGDDGFLTRDPEGNYVPSTPTPASEFEESDGSVVLDEEGQPVPTGSTDFERDTDGSLVLVDGVAVRKS